MCLGMHVLRCMHRFVFWAFCVCKMFVDVCLCLCTYVWHVLVYASVYVCMYVCRGRFMVRRVPSRTLLGSQKCCDIKAY